MDAQHTPEKSLTPTYKDEQGHFHGDTTTIFGRTINMNVYTVVFFALGILTLIEVALFELPRGFLTIPVMIGLALIKAGLVVYFYMHLNKDSRMFAVALLVPTVMVVLATFFLMIVPTGY
jgi:cytochrome c oxidase subunit 4